MTGHNFSPSLRIIILFLLPLCFHHDDDDDDGDNDDDEHAVPYDQTNFPYWTE